MTYHDTSNLFIRSVFTTLAMGVQLFEQERMLVYCLTCQVEQMARLLKIEFADTVFCMKNCFYYRRLPPCKQVNS